MRRARSAATSTGDETMRVKEKVIQCDLVASYYAELCSKPNERRSGSSELSSPSSHYSDRADLDAGLFTFLYSPLFILHSSCSGPHDTPGSPDPLQPRDFRQVSSFSKLEDDHLIRIMMCHR